MITYTHRVSHRVWQVLNIFFCETYHFPLAIFDFPAYMREVLDREVTQLVEVDVSSWMFLCFIIILNLLAHELAGDVAATSPQGSVDQGAIVFAAMGWLQLLFAVLLAALSRRSEKKLLAIIGCNSTVDYALYVRKAESKLREHAADVALAKNALRNRRGSVSINR